MGFPQVAATNTSSEAANTTTHTVNLPAGIAVGDLLIVVMAADGTPSFGWPAGWSIFSSFSLTGGPSTVLGARYRVADGTEGATISVTSTASEKSAHQSYRISNWRADSPPLAVAAVATSATADPPSISPSWGLDDALWLIFVGVDADIVFSGDPANYGSAIENDSGGAATGAKLRSLRRSLRAASEDPGAFTHASNQWVALTIAIQGRPSGFGRRAFLGGP